ncbi:glycoside hydrolase family 31 protein [Deinococcus cellulosilyticus]|uniref:Alpha-glucosidase n=1 Tax=Deinococcus cellulosilyticus (strain DSM 18568 / NBRC 106333 / KACC 11606 / 5516J-15) TaxID=1223518 RepID=A0A511NAA1_DEIC1|nr:TIM-barrel domain-containing protein [Deinococcus cellulosilyticus]GEM49743.1 alpha-glucosidase [Deinococcus cellulosilyticus NBRC 106333 = KACC 11606]
MFEKIEIVPKKAKLSGIHARAEITSPLECVWRYRVRPKGYIQGDDLPPAESVAVLNPGQLPFEIEDEGWTLISGKSILRIKPEGQMQILLDGIVVCELKSLTGIFEPEEPVNRKECTVNLYAPYGEAYVGFGEKVGPLNKRGLKFTFWNTDVAPHHPDTDPLYQSIPFFMGLHEGKVWGFFLDETSRSEVDIAKEHPETITWKTESNELDMYFIMGNTPAEILDRYTELTGKITPKPLWSMGLHQSRYSYTSQEEVLNIIEHYRKYQIPLDAVHLDIHYMNGYRVFTFNQHRFPDPKALCREAEKQGVKIITIMDPGIKEEKGYFMYDEATKKDFLVKTNRGDVMVGAVWPGRAVFPDFIQEDVRQWWGEKHQIMLDSGISGFWNDMNEPSSEKVHVEHDPKKVQGKTLPDDAMHGKIYHLEAHNMYGMGMCQATFEGLKKLAPKKRPFIVTRAGYAGIQRYATVWTGDNSAYWEHMEMNLQLLLSLGLSGIPCVGSDIGGFLGNSSGELVTRWMWLGVFYPFMRNHSSMGTDYKEPWAFPEHLPFIKGAAEFRYRLLPYLYTLMKVAQETGLPSMRAMLIHYPEDGAHLYDQFLSGENLLVAPIMKPYHTHRVAYFPTRGWMELNSSTAQQYGSGYEVVSSGLDRIPVFLKPGGIVPFTSVAQFTTTARWETIEWHVNVSAEGEFRLYEDEGEGEADGDWTTVTIQHEEGRVRLTRKGGPKRAESLMVYGHGERAPYRVELRDSWKTITLPE